jgi:hypothetical protein
MAQGKHQRGRRLGAVLSAVAAIAALTVVGALVVGPVAAQATGSEKGSGGSGSQTVKITINVPALVLDNLCNADVVNLSGDMTITTTTTPRSDGSYTVRSSAIAKGLKGSRIAPPPAIGYKGDDAENTYSYVAPPPYPSTHTVTHWTKLVPQGKAPTMYLVTVLRETTMADGTTVPVLERAYLACSPPSHH